MNYINLILSKPVPVAIEDIYTLFDGVKIEIPPSGVMPASTQHNSRALINMVVSGKTYQEILDILATGTPPMQIFGAQDLLATPNPDYDPEDPESEPMVTVVYEPLNNSVWNFLPDRDSGPQTQLHGFQGAAAWPTR